MPCLHMRLHEAPVSQRARSPKSRAPRHPHGVQASTACSSTACGLITPSTPRPLSRRRLPRPPLGFSLHAPQTYTSRASHALHRWTHLQRRGNPYRAFSHGQSLSNRTALHSHPLRSPSPTPRPVAQQPDSAPQPSAPRHRPRHQPRHRPRHQPSHRPRHQPRYRPRHPTRVFHIMLTRQPWTTFRSSLRPHQPPRVSAVSSRSDIMLTLTHASTLSTNPELRRRGGVGPRVVSPPVRFPSTVGTVSCACLLTFDVTESPTHVCVHTSLSSTYIFDTQERAQPSCSECVPT